MVDAEPDDLLLFTPVPLDRVRKRGWSAERQRAFIAVLARTGIVRVAAASVGMTARSAYQLAARVDYTHPFIQAWDLAIDRARETAGSAALNGVLDPERRPILRRGQVVGWTDKPDARLVLAAIKVVHSRRDPQPSAADRRFMRLSHKRNAEQRGSEQPALAEPSTRQKAAPAKPKPAPAPPRVTFF